MLVWRNRCLANFNINGALNSDVGNPLNAEFDLKDAMGMRDKEIEVIKPLCDIHWSPKE